MLNTEKLCADLQERFPQWSGWIARLEVEEAMKPLHEVSGKDITIDCSQLDYIASSGLRILLGLLKSAKAKENHVVLKNLNDEIKDVFKMTGFIDLFDIE